MNIDNMKFGELKEIVALFNGTTELSNAWRNTLDDHRLSWCFNEDRLVSVST